MKKLTAAQKQHVIDLVVKTPHHLYYHRKTPEYKGGSCRQDAEYTIPQVYEAFKDDPFWDISRSRYCADPELHTYIIFQERSLVERYQQDYQNTLMLFMHYILKGKRWRGGAHHDIDIDVEIYGGFARSAFIAHTRCKSAIYTTLLCWRRVARPLGVCVPPDIARMLGALVLSHSLDDFTWFAEDDDINDMDILVTYPESCGVVPEAEFADTVHHIRDSLSELCYLEETCVHSYRPVYYETFNGERIDNSCDRWGRTSHCAGDFYTYLVLFDSDQYKGKFLSHFGSTIKLDITTMIQNDQSDADVNNLVLYFDRETARLRFRQRKRIHFSEGDLTLCDIAENVAHRRFRPIILQYTAFANYHDFKEAYWKLQDRVRDMEEAGWTQHPDFKQIETAYHANSEDNSDLQCARHFFSKA